MTYIVKIKKKNKKKSPMICVYALLQPQLRHFNTVRRPHPQNIVTPTTISPTVI